MSETMGPTDLSRFEVATKTWLERACPLIAAAGGHRSICEGFVVRESPTTFRRICRMRTVYVPGLESVAFQIPEWAFVLEAFDADLGSVKGRWVGAGSDYALLTADRICLALLPTDNLFSTPRDLTVPDPEKVEQRIGALAQLLDSAAISVLCINPLWQFGAPGRIDLATDLWIGPMEDLDIERAMTMNVIAGDLALRRTFEVQRDRRFAIYRRSVSKKQILDAFPAHPPDAGDDPSYTSSHTDRLLNVLVLSGSGTIKVGATMRRVELGWPLSTESTLFESWAEPALDDRPISRQGLHLDADGAAKTQRFWRRLSHGTGSTGLELALRRLRFAAGRESEEDRTLDLMISAEALFIPKGSSHEELSFRTSLHASFFLSPDDEVERERIFRLLRTGYEVRSKIAHGESPENVQMDGRPVMLRELNSAIESIIRLALQRRFEGDSSEPDWLNVVVGR